jgi:hypothetical protein
MKFKNGEIKAPTGLDWVFNFGKYKDEQPTIRELLDRDPSYVVWCCENLDWFDVDAYIYDMALEKDTSWYRSGEDGDRFSIY